MCVGCPGVSLFGDTSQYIKIQNGDFVAIKGSNTMERLITSGLRIPYKQILKSRIVLKAGQANYLLNHLGLGDNATFLALKTSYNEKSVNKDDNYITWSYYDDLTRAYAISELMVLTGNPTNRIKQIYLTNPNTKYPVIIDVMVAIIDDQYSFFPDVINQSGTTFTNLSYDDLHTYVINESIVVKDSLNRPLVYIGLSDINSIQRTGSLISIDDETLGNIFLLFNTDYDAAQAESIILYTLENSNINIDTLDPLADSTPPIVYFNSTVGGTGATISSSATSSIPVDTTMGYTFSTSISLSQFGTYSGSTYSLYPNDLSYLLVSQMIDNRDGQMTFTGSNFIISGTNGTYSSISSTGSFTLNMNVFDRALNNLDDVVINLTITS